MSNLVKGKLIKWENAFVDFLRRHWMQWVKESWKEKKNVKYFEDHHVTFHQSNTGRFH